MNGVAAATQAVATSMTQAPDRVNPSGVRYSTGAIPLATPAKSAIRKFYPVNGGGSYTATGANVIQLPIAAEGMFLDAAGHSFLKFDVKTNIDSSSGILARAPAHHFIKRLRILSATGQQLEDIDDYNALHQLMIDLQCSPNYCDTVLAARSGVQQHSIFAGGRVAEADGDFPGKLTTTSKTYSLNLMSGLLSQPKYIPLLATKGGIQLEMTLESSAVALQSTNTATYEITNVEYVAELIDFGPDFNARFKAMLMQTGGVLMSGSTYRTHTTTLSGGTQTVSISERSRSIKSIFSILRPTGGSHDSYDTEDGDSVGNRVQGLVTGYQYRVGSVTYPDHVVKFTASNVSEPISQAFKALGGALTDVHHGTCITPDQFAKNERDATNNRKQNNGVEDSDPLNGVTYGREARGQAVFAMSFESTTQDTSMLESGLNSAAQALPIELRFDGNTEAAKLQRFNAYVLVDAIFSFLPNGEVMASV